MPAGIVKVVVGLFASPRVIFPLSTTHLSNTLPVGSAFAVRVTVVPIVAVAEEAVPSVTVRVYSMYSQTAFKVVFSVTVMVAPAAFSVPLTLQPLNCLPSGAVKPFAGRVYSPKTPVTSAIVPVPPLAAKVTV